MCDLQTSAAEACARFALRLLPATAGPAPRAEMPTEGIQVLCTAKKGESAAGRRGKCLGAARAAAAAAAAASKAARQKTPAIVIIAALCFPCYSGSSAPQHSASMPQKGLHPLRHLVRVVQRNGASFTLETTMRRSAPYVLQSVRLRVGAGQEPPGQCGALGSSPPPATATEQHL